MDSASVINTCKSRRFDLLLIWVLMVSVAPFVFEDAELYPPKIFVVLVCPILLCKLLVKRMSISDKVIPVILLLQASYFLILYANYYPVYSYLFNSFQFVVVLLLYLFIDNVTGYDAITRSALIVILLIAAGAALGFILALMGVIEPTILFERSSTESVYNYWVTFTNTQYSFAGRNIIRPAGYFMEAGVLGFYVIHALLLNRISIKSSKVEHLLLALGLFTTSFACYISMILYFLLLYDKTSSKRRRVTTCIVITSIVSIMIYVYSIRNEDWFGMMYNWTIRRFLGGHGMAVSGFKNRSDIVTQSWGYFMKYPLLGAGMGYVLKHVPEALGAIMGRFVAYGVVGTAVLFLHVIYMCVLSMMAMVRASSFTPIAVVFILLLNYLQRPFVTDVFAYLMIILLIKYIHDIAAGNDNAAHRLCEN